MSQYIILYVLIYQSYFADSAFMQYHLHEINLYKLLRNENRFSMDLFSFLFCYSSICLPRNTAATWASFTSV